MTPHLPPDDAPLDPLAAYADGDPRAVRAARPPEPSEAEWAVIGRRVRARLARPVPIPKSATPRRRGALWCAVASALTAAAVVWVVSVSHPAPVTREVAVTVPLPADVPLALQPLNPPDPLAEFAVLPIAEADEVVLLRVPGEGWLPVGTHPLAGELELATADDVELDEPDPAWPNATPTPGIAPMIYAAKPR